MEPKSQMPNKPLAQWTWDEIIAHVNVYLYQLKELTDTCKRLEITRPLNVEVTYVPEMHPDRAEIVSRAFLESKAIQTHINALTREIRRRARLVGGLN